MMIVGWERGRGGSDRCSSSAQPWRPARGRDGHRLSPSLSDRLVRSSSSVESCSFSTHSKRLRKCCNVSMNSWGTRHKIKTVLIYRNMWKRRCADDHSACVPFSVFLTRQHTHLHHRAVLRRLRSLSKSPFHCHRPSSCLLLTESLIWSLVRSL